MTWLYLKVISIQFLNIKLTLTFRIDFDPLRMIHADFYKNKKMTRSMYLNLNKTIGTFENIE